MLLVPQQKILTAETDSQMQYGVAFLVALINVNVRSLRWRVAGWMVVVAVALTRLYLNVHSVSDVVGGILLGLALAAVAAVISANADQKPMIER